MGLPVDDLFRILHDMLLKYDVHIIWGSIDTNRQSKYIRQINEFNTPKPIYSNPKSTFVICNLTS